MTKMYTKPFFVALIGPIMSEVHICPGFVVRIGLRGAILYRLGVLIS